jgi:UDP-N-acetylmuramoyl-tripeptide--D-alanyl-D-alanine ligase
VSLDSIPLLILVAAALVFCYRRTLTYLHIFQQDEYDGPRFLRWLASSGSFDKTLSLALLGLGIADLLLARAIPWAFPLLAAVLFVTFARREANPLKASKKKLVLTARAKRVLSGALALTTAAAVGCALSGTARVNWLLVVQFVPLSLVLSNIALIPVERAIQNRYWREAHEKLTRLSPKVIGVTGSFGKTSVKHILGHILEMVAPTLITPGSVNTPMGISRIIREQLDSRHRFFVVEMGAYGPGSIARLCRLAPPDLGVITAIGLAHYERFKSLDTVARAKFELADAVLARSGTVVVAQQVLDCAAARDYVSRQADSFVVCGAAQDGALSAGTIRQDAAGVSVEVTWQGRSFTLKAPIFGAHHGMNMALAFAAACSLGVEPEIAVTALRSIPQIPHRLEVKRQGDGSILVDDAYNSNPIGFASALNVLDQLRPDGGRRILVTPGMVELGEAHAAEHARLGALAARCVDTLLLVCPERVPTFLEAFAAGAPAATVLPCATFAEAQTWLGQNLARDDVVLLENDLPDLYERRLKL